MSDASNSAKLPHQENLIQDGADKINNGAELIQRGADQIQNKTDQTKIGNELSANAEQIKSIAEHIQNGVRQIQDGAKQIQDGSKQIQDGAKQIQDEVKQLKNESETLEGSWKEIQTEVGNRYVLINQAIEHLEKVGYRDDPKRVLAAIDVFVEKAQLRLTTRANFIIKCGAGLAAFALITLLSSAAYLNGKTVPDLIGKGMKISDMGGYGFTLLIIKSTTATALILGAVYFSASLAKDLLNEGMTLFKTRHSLRFGRMYAYIKKGRLDQKEDLLDLERVFNWNSTGAQGGLHLDPEQVAKTPSGRLVEQPGEIAKAFNSQAASKNAYLRLALVITTNIVILFVFFMFFKS